MTRYDSFFQPLQTAGVALPNRMVRAAHGAGFAGEDLIAYHEARARGGVGLSVNQATSVHARTQQGVPVLGLADGGNDIGKAVRDGERAAEVVQVQQHTVGPALHHRDLPGEGELPLVAFLRTLLEHGVGA